MRHATLSFGLALLLGAPSLALAGPLYGTVKLGSAPAAALTVSVACPAFSGPQASASATTDQSGSFSLLVSATGRCEMRVSRGGQHGAPFQVFVSDKPLRFDFEINSDLQRVR